MNKLSHLKIFQVIVPAIFVFFTLVTGLAAGFWFGTTNLGQWLPRLFAVGTGGAFFMALYVSLRPNLLAADQAVAETPRFFYLCLFVTAMILGSSVSAIPAWQLSPQDRVAGFIPYSDAQAYYRQVLAWPSAHFDAWNSRRPLNAALNILEFHLGGSTLLGMQLIRVGVAALAITCFIVTLAGFTGAAAALASGFALLIWTWPYASSLLSEINGITMASASFALLLIALGRKQSWFAFLGLFGLVLAYAFRPYNPMMPAIFAVATAWAWSAKIPSWKPTLIMVIAAIFLVLAVPKAIYIAYGDPSGSPNANTGSIILGLARGTDWKEASEYIMHGHQTLSEKEANALMYRTAVVSVLDDPRPLIKALSVSFARFVFVVQQKMGAVFGLPDTISTGSEGNMAVFLFAVAKEPAIWTASLFMFISIIGVFIMARPSHVVPFLAAVSMFSLIAIAPVVFTDGGWRVVATHLPGVSLLILAAPLAVRRGIFRWKASTDYPNNASTEAFVKRKNGFQSNNAIAYSLTILLIVIFALIYPQILRLISNNIDNHPHAITIDVNSTSKRKWTGFNSASIHLDDLFKWAVASDHTKLQSFLSDHGYKIISLGYNQGRTVLYVSDALQITDMDQYLDDNYFIIRHRFD